MEDSEIEILASGDLKEIFEILQKFLRKDEDVFYFPSLSENSRRVILWTALFQHLQNKAAVPVHLLCLSAIRVLSRDKSEVDGFICEKWMSILIEKAGLYNFIDFDEGSMVQMDLLQKEFVVEALKCLCNLAFNSEVARALCAHTCIAQGMISRIRVYKDIPYRDEIMLFDMKLLFILTALRQDIKAKIKDELHGMDYLISCLNELILEATGGLQELGASAGYGNPLYTFQDNQQAIVCEVLKTQFNLIIRHGPEEPINNEDEESMYLKLMSVVTTLLYIRASSEEKLMELRSNITNLLTSVPIAFYQFLSPNLTTGDQCQYTFEGKNMDGLQALIEFLEHKLVLTTNTRSQYEHLAPILTVLCKSTRGCRAQRKYLRRVVLPPLRDVSQPPEWGNTLRNRLCKLLTTPITAVRDLVAEFLSVMCKEKVGRMVKYTGFGNAAGHLAQKGLLGGGNGEPYSSSSDDSDTEEYLEAQPNIDPVVGCTRPPRINPFEGMSEEQKEHEAMKLVNLFDKLLCDGVVKPARIGADGRPQPMEHVLELREHPPNRLQS